MAFLKTLLLELTRPLWCSMAGIKRAIVFAYLDKKSTKSSSDEKNL